MRRLFSPKFKRIVYGFLCLFLAQIKTATAQTSVIDFDSPLHVFYPFNGCAVNTASDPVNPVNHVVQFVNVGSTWEGATLKLPEDVFLDSQKVITIRFYKGNSNPEPVILKLTDADRANAVEVKVTVSDTGWSTQTFNFSQATISGTNTTINAAGGYSNLELFINGGSSISGSYFIDDIVYPNYESAHALDVVYTHLVYQDEFSSVGPIDTSNWFAEVVPPNPWGWHNNEKQHYTNRAANVYTSNGTLKIVAKKETFTAYGLTTSYTSARLNSKFSFTYGRIDVRAKLPNGDGTWPAIWMLGTSHGNNWMPKTKAWPDCGEIDVMEHWGNHPGKIHGSIHTPSSHGATVNTQSVLKEDVFNGWHVYSMNWSPDQISFLVDGFLYYTYKPGVKDASTWPFNDPQFILLNVAMGGIYPIDPNFSESKMEIDYVRVYQNSGIGVEDEKLNRLKVYPNPTSGVFCIDAKETIDELVVIDMAGQVVLNVHSPSHKIDISALKTGVYLLNARGANGKTSIKKVIKL